MSVIRASTFPTFRELVINQGEIMQLTGHRRSGSKELVTRNQEIRKQPGVWTL